MNTLIKKNIIIVEDNLIIATETQKRLQKAGYKIIGIFESGEELLKRIEKLEPHLILMDIMIKGKLSGIDTAKEILKKIDIPIIYLTAYSDNATLQKARESGSFAYLVKPVTSEVLLVNIEMALYKHAQIKNPSADVLSSLGHLDNAIITTDSNGKVFFINSSAEKILDLSERGIDSDSIHDLLYPCIELADSRITFNKESLTELKRKLTLPVKLKRISGKTEDAELTVNQIRSVHEEITGLIFTIKLRNISENFNLLKEMETRYKPLLENIDLPAFILNNEGSIFYFNKFAASLLGRPNSDILDRNLFDNFVPSESKNDLKAIYLSSQINKSVEPIKTFSLRNNFGEKSIRWNYLPQYNKKDEIIGFLMIGEDISQEKFLEDELRKLKQLME